MHRSHRNQSSRNLISFTKRAKWLAVILLAPLLLLGTLQRATFFAHAHSDSGVHVHVVGLLDGGKHAAAGHAEHHTHHHAHYSAGSAIGLGDSVGQECDLQAEGSGGVIICFDIDTPPSARRAEYGRIRPPPVAFDRVSFVLRYSAGPLVHAGSPGGFRDADPMNLRALRAGDRLVRTSCALLI